MKQLLIIILCASFLTQCTPDKKSKKSIRYDDLVGQWELASDTALHMSNNIIRRNSLIGPASDGYRFIFQSDSTVQTGETWINRIEYWTPFAYKAPFRLDGDTLCLFTLDLQLLPTRKIIPSEIYRVRIHDIKNDTLTFEPTAGKYIHYKKTTSIPDTLPKFDAIVLSTFGCYGKCPITNTVIHSNGDVLFFGENYVDSLGFYTAKLTPSEYTEIENLFRQADIAHTGNIAAEYTDGEAIAITFVKDGKIYKTIVDASGTKTLPALLWAYTRLRHLHSFIKLTKIPSLPAPLTEKLSLGNFKKDDKEIRLAVSERFLLWNYLLSGKSSNKKAKTLFNLDFDINYAWPIEGYRAPLPITEIKTDGQLFTFELENKHFVTIDIGFNFITRNPALIHRNWNTF